MRNREILFGVLVLFALLAVPVASVYADGGESVMVSSTADIGWTTIPSTAAPDDCEEIKYDDGTIEGMFAWSGTGSWGPRFAVHFTRPEGYETLKTARFGIHINESVPSNSFNWSVHEWTGTAPGSEIASGTTTPSSHGWHDVDMDGISVPEDFVISVHQQQGLAPYLWYDTDSPADRSWNYPYSYEGYSWSEVTEMNYMIRAIVCKAGPDINVTPEAIDLELPPGESASEPLNICNDGGGSLTYNISISYDTTESGGITIAGPAPYPGDIEELVGVVKGAISSTDETAVSEGEEIGYDDGEADDGVAFKVAGHGMAVHFTSLSCDTLSTARFYMHTINDSAPSNSFDWSVLGWTGTAPGSEIASGTTTPSSTGWYDVDMGGVTVPEDFVIAMYWKQGYAPYLGYDDDPPTHDRSLFYSEKWFAWPYEHDLMIRAVMNESGGWLSVDRTDGTVEAGDCNETIVTVDTAGLDPGDYSARIIIENNDPDENPTVVSVNLTVSDEVIVSINDASASEGSTATIPISITNVTDLCGASIWLHYDSSVVIVESVSDGNMGSITHYADNVAGITRMAWDSPSGKTGDLVFAHVTLKAVAEGASPLDLEVKDLYNSSFGDISHSIVNGTFEVRPPLMEGDVTDLNECVSLKDSTKIKFYLVGRAELDEDQLICADTWDDGTVNLKDSTFIQKWLVDTSTPLWQSPADDEMMKPVLC